MEQLLRITMIFGACLWVAGLFLMLFPDDDPARLLMVVGFPFLIIALSFVFIEWREQRAEWRQERTEWREERALEHEIRMLALAREAKLAKGELPNGEKSAPLSTISV